MLTYQFIKFIEAEFREKSLCNCPKLAKLLRKYRRSSFIEYYGDVYCCFINIPGVSTSPIPFDWSDHWNPKIPAKYNPHFMIAASCCGDDDEDLALDVNCPFVSNCRRITDDSDEKVASSVLKFIADFRQNKAIIIQANFRGWCFRKRLRHNPHTSLGKYLILKEFSEEQHENDTIISFG